MKFKREKKILNKAEKLARKELLKFIFTIALLMLMVFLLAFKCGAEFDDMSLANYLYSNIYFTLALFIAYIAILIFVYFSSKQSFIDDAYKKVTKDYSKQLVEKLLIPGEPTNVILINTRNAANKYFVLGLQEQNICEFYAVLQENHNSISIYSRVKDKEDLLLDSITKEDFTTYCELPDNP